MKDAMGIRKAGSWSRVAIFSVAAIFRYGPRTCDTRRICGMSVAYLHEPG
jgi:hypothetical protein